MTRKLFAQTVPLLLGASLLTSCDEAPKGFKQWEPRGPLAPVATATIPAYVPDSRFVKEKPPEPVVQAPVLPEGEVLFNKSGCAGCHAAGAPFHEKLAGAKGKTDQRIAAWILSPKTFKPETIMPPYGATLTEAQALTLARWVLSGGPEKMAKPQ